MGDTSKKDKKRDKKEGLLERESSEEDLLNVKHSTKKHLFGKKLVVGSKKEKKDKKHAVGPELGSPDSITSAIIPKSTSGGKSKHKDKSNKSAQKEKWSYSNETSEYIPPGANEPIFGVPLAQAWAHSCSHVGTSVDDPIKVPAIIRMCIDYVQDNGMQMEGIYRISPPKPRMDELRSRVDGGHELTISFQSAHEAAALVKMFLRELPEHILTDDLASVFERVAAECPCPRSGPCECLSGDRIKANLSQLPMVNYQLCAYIFQHFMQSDLNKMRVENVGVIVHMMLSLSMPLTNILLRNTALASHHSKSAARLFEDVHVKRWSHGRAVEKENNELLQTKAAAEVELAVKQKILEELHARVSKAGDDEQASAQLWEVQRLVTELKRRVIVLGRAEDAAQATSAVQEEKTDTVVKHSPVDEGVQSTAFDGPCMEMFEEKQLLAMNSELQESLAMERRSINRLLRQIHQLESQHHVRKETAERRGSGDTEAWSSAYAEQVERHERLLADLIEEKQHLARLRAHIEVATLHQQGDS